MGVGGASAQGRPAEGARVNPVEQVHKPYPSKNEEGAVRPDQVARRPNVTVCILGGVGVAEVCVVVVVPLLRLGLAWSNPSSVPQGFPAGVWGPLGAG